MLVLPEQSYLGWKVSLGIFHGLALGSTGFRLLYRFRANKWWWDDYVLTVPFVLDVVYAILFYTRFRGSSDSSSNDDNLLKILMSYWLSDLFLITIIWSTKIVLCLSVLQVFSKGTPPRRWTLVLTWFMTLSWVSCAITSAATCRNQALLFIDGQKQSCFKVGGFLFKRIYFETNNLVATLIFALFCLGISSRADLSSAERRFILSIFGASSCIFFLTALVVGITLNRGVSLGEDQDMVLASIEQIEAANSLLMANLSIVLSVVRQRLLGRSHNSWNGYAFGDDSGSLSPTDSQSHSCTSRSLTPITLTEISESPYSLPSNLSDQFSLEVPCRSLRSLKIEPLE